jgi:hypothetical protein
MRKRRKTASHRIRCHPAEKLLYLLMLLRTDMNYKPAGKDAAPGWIYRSEVLK